MIQILRPENGPASLKCSGERQTQLDCAAYDRGARKFRDIKSYSKQPVKKKLLEVHHNKCCFCESWYPERIDFDVEHFRPRNAYRQNRAQTKDKRPGYYWLAYRWDNLLLSCATCNRVYKRTFFPLENPGERATNHHKDLNAEIPFFVDPVGENPRDHIRFSGAVPMGITPKGKVTIIRLGLCRPGVTGDRRKHLNTIIKSYQVMKLSETHSNIPEFEALAKELREFIEDAMRPESMFSSMVIDYVASHPL